MKARAILKRSFECAAAGAALVSLSPLLVTIAAAVKLTSKGPVIYQSERLGLEGRTFLLWKFRSMAAGSPQMVDEDFKTVIHDSDDRLTPIGKYLRIGFDELPQLVNVFRGDMSFVGPRPERPFFVSELSQDIPYYTQRLSVKPGITGWAQIGFRYGSSIEDAKRKLQFDLYYLKNLSFELDLIILFRTLGTFLRGAC